MIPDLLPFAVGDLNHDGLPDIVELRYPLVDWGYPGPLVYNVYTCQPDGSFKLANTYQPYAGGPITDNGLKLVLADFNGEGELDIAAFQTPGASRNSQNGYFQVMLGNGDATFTPSYIAFPLQKSWIPSVAADVNGDGRADLIELDGFASSYHIIPAIAGPSFQARLVSNPVVGGNGLLRLTKALTATAATVELSASDPAINVPGSITIPAGQVSLDVPFQIASAFNMNHVFSIQGQSGSEVHSVYGYQANPALPVGFALSVGSQYPPTTLPGRVIAPPFLFYLTSTAGYASDLHVSCAGLPAGASCGIGLPTIDLPAGGQASQFFTVAVPDSLGLGTYSFQVAATDGLLTQTANASFQVVDFSLTVDMLVLSTLPTATTSMNVQSSSVNNNGQSIAMTCATSNPAITCQLPGPTLGVGSGEKVTILTQNAALGTYTITLTGKIGPLVHTQTIQLTVGNVVTNINPTSATAALGTQSNFTVTLTSQGGFAGSFEFSCTNDVGSLFCTASPSPVPLPANGSVSTTLTVSLISKAMLAPLPVSRVPHPKFQSRELVGIFVALLAVVFIAGLLSLSRYPRRKFLAASATLALLLALSMILGSCGGGAGGGGGGGRGGGGGGGGGGGSATTIHVQVQATTGGLTIPMGTITLTVP